jgi:hypothetical protein
MRRALAIGLLCGGLGACAIPSPFPVPVIPGNPGDLAADRRACNASYPPQVGNYLAHAQCVNAAVDRDAIPFSRHPDIVQLQEQLRLKYSAMIDRGVITPQAGEHKMAEADAIVNQAIRDRDYGRVATANHRVDRLHAMLQ